MPVEEQEKFRAILQEGGFDVTGSEEGPLIDVILAGAQSGKSEIDVIGALHGTFPPLQSADALANVIDVADDLSMERELTAAYLETGLLEADYIVIEMANQILGKEWLPQYVQTANAGGIERVLV